MEGRYIISGLIHSAKIVLSKKIKKLFEEKEINTLIFPLNSWILRLDTKKSNDTFRERFEYKKYPSHLVNCLKVKGIVNLYFLKEK
jgi:hypothetical protein